MIILYLIVAFLICGVIHEFGHWIIARIYGQSIKFKFSFGRFYVPRFTWQMPNIDPAQQAVIAVSGFGLELLWSIAFFCSPYPLTHLMLVACGIHLFLYPMYAGDVSDWTYVKF